MSLNRNSDNAVAIHVEDLSLAYIQEPVLLDVDLDIDDGKMTAIVGPNGAGKSTLIKAMIGLLKPLAGTVLFKNKPYSKAYKTVAYVPQSSSVNWDFPTTVRDVVGMGRYIHAGWCRRLKRSDWEIADAAIKRLELEELRDRHISELSGGQKQRVFIARAIAQQADIYLLDEPLQGVDAFTEKIIVKVLQEFRDEGKCVVVVHHALNTVKEYFDNIVLLNKTIVATGPVKKYFTDELVAKTYKS